MTNSTGRTKAKWLRRPLALSMMIMGILTPLVDDPTAAEFDPVLIGQELVGTYCSSCHEVGRTGDSPLPQAPRFRDLHLRYDVEELSEALVEGIATAHPEMPQFSFEPDQAAAIVSYLKSLEVPPLSKR